MRLGYARVSTEDQRLDLQRARLAEAECGRIFEEKISGAARQRPALEQLLREMRAGDVLVVTRLDRLARSTAELLRIAEAIAERSGGVAVAGGALGGHDHPDRADGPDRLRRGRRVRAGPDPAAHR